MIAASCHCGAVHIATPAEPEFVSSCNCSLCRRLGTLWAYYPADQVSVTGPTVAYVWGDKRIELRHCASCGCTTHWEPIDRAAIPRIGVNARLMEPDVVAGARVRRFDGADTWTFLD